MQPEQAQDREILLNALRTSKEKDNPSILALIAGLEAQDGLYEQALGNINRLTQTFKIHQFYPDESQPTHGFTRRCRHKNGLPKASRKIRITLMSAY